MLGKADLPLVVGFAIFISGCVLPPSESVFRLKTTEGESVGEIADGFRDVHWERRDTGYWVAGTGFFGGDDRSVLAFPHFGYPVKFPRHIVIHPLDENTYQLDLWLDLTGSSDWPTPRVSGAHFVGRVGPPKELLFWRVQFDLDEVHVRRTDQPDVTGVLNGRVVATYWPTRARGWIQDAQLATLSGRLQDALQDPHPESRIALWRADRAPRQPDQLPVTFQTSIPGIRSRGIEVQNVLREAGLTTAEWDCVDDPHGTIVSGSFSIPTAQLPSLDVLPGK